MRHLEATAMKEVPKLLQRLLGAPVTAEVAGHPDRGVDLAVRSSDRVYLIQVKASADVAAIEQALRQLDAYSSAVPHVAMLVVPYMGPKAREYARERGLSWLDLSGNADIHAPGLRILVEGKPNRFASPGRPSSLFSPKASRLSRAMLVEPDRWWLQRDLADATGVSAGFVSKVVFRMLEDELIVRQADGGIRPRAPSVLLDAWAQSYEFAKHDLTRFHAVGRTGLAVLKQLAQRLNATDMLWAATGLGAAWMWSEYADFRLTTIYVSEPLHDPEMLGLRPVDRGENVWVVVPRDDGVFYRTEQLVTVQCVHPVQTYLDLLAHPERAKEAATRLRADLLAWRA